MKIDESLIYKIVKYTVGCSLALLIKIFLTNFLILSTTSSVEAAYLIVHIVLLFSSFAYHTKITFNSTVSGRLFGHFFRVVLILKLFDYLVFVIGIKMVENFFKKNLSVYSSTLVVSTTIIASSAIIFVMRFFLYRRILGQRLA